MTKARSNATAPNAKGTLVVGNGTDASTTLAVASTAGYVLTVDSAETTGLKWAAVAAGGKVLQVVTATTSTSVQTFSTSYADSGLSASITPSSTSSKILAVVSQNFWVGCNQASVYMNAQLMRGSTALQVKWFGIEAARNGTSPLVCADETPFVWLDSPSTTSATTYKTQFKLAQADIGGWGGYANYNSTNSSITLLEIGA